MAERMLAARDTGCWGLAGMMVPPAFRLFTFECPPNSSPHGVGTTRIQRPDSPNGGRTLPRPECPVRRLVAVWGRRAAFQDLHNVRPERRERQWRAEPFGGFLHRHRVQELLAEVVEAGAREDDEVGLLAFQLLHIILAADQPTHVHARAEDG